MKFKRGLSGILALVLTIGMFSGLSITAFAANTIIKIEHSDIDADKIFDMSGEYIKPYGLAEEGVIVDGEYAGWGAYTSGKGTSDYFRYYTDSKVLYIGSPTEIVTKDKLIDELQIPCFPSRIWKNPVTHIPIDSKREDAPLIVNAVVLENFSLMLSSDATTGWMLSIDQDGVNRVYLKVINNKELFKDQAMTLFYKERYGGLNDFYFVETEDSIPVEELISSNVKNIADSDAFIIKDKNNVHIPSITRSVYWTVQFTDKVKNLSHSFSNSTVKYSLDDKIIPNIEILDGYSAANYSITIDQLSKMTKLKKIGANTFSALNFYKEVLDLSNLPLQEIGENAFYNSGLGGVVLPSTLKTIDTNAFNGNSNKNMQPVIIPRSVQSIGNTPFWNTTKLRIYDTSYAHEYCSKYRNFNYEIIDPTYATGIEITGADKVANQESVKLTAKLIPNNVTKEYQTITWSCDSEKAIVNNGTVTGKEPGEINIKASVPNADGTVEVTYPMVVKANPTDLKVTPNPVEIGIGQEKQLNYEYLPADTLGTVTYESVNPLVAQVSKTGKVTGLSIGTTSIKVICHDVTKIIPVSVGSSFVPDNPDTDKIPVKSIEAADLVVRLDETALINAIVKPTNATNKGLTYASSDPTIVSVASNGVVSGHKVGSVQITITSEDDTSISKVITVRCKNTSINIDVNGGSSSDVTVDNSDNIFGDVDININVKFTVEDKTSETPNKAEIEAALPEGTLINSYYEMTLKKQENGGVEEAVTELVNPLKITMNVPSAIQNKPEIGVVRVHNGKAEIIPSELNKEKTKITFNSDKFSTFALYSSDTISDTTINKEGESDILIRGTIESSGSSSEGEISVVVPTRLDFIIDTDRNFISGEYTFKNTGNSDISIKIKGVKPKSGTNVNLVIPDTYEDWTIISKEDTISKMGLKLGETDLSVPNASLIDLLSKTDKKLSLTGFYGHNWDNSENIVLDYDMTLILEKKAVTP